MISRANTARSLSPSSGDAISRCSSSASSRAKARMTRGRASRRDVSLGCGTSARSKNRTTSLSCGKKVRFSNRLARMVTISAISGRSRHASAVRSDVGRSLSLVLRRGLRSSAAASSRSISSAVWSPNFARASMIPRRVQEQVSVRSYRLLD